MRRITEGFLAMVLVLAFASVGTAFQNEPEGFRELKWGDPPTEEMVFSYSKGLLDSYSLPGGKMYIGDASFFGVKYNFFQNKFMMAFLSFWEEENYDLLKKILLVRYGLPTKEEFYQLDWLGGESIITLKYDFTREGGFLSISSDALFTELLETEKIEEAEKAADDF